MEFWHILLMATAGGFLLGVAIAVIWQEKD